MTIGDYITSCFKDFGVAISDANLLEILLPYKLDKNIDVETLNEKDIRSMNVGIIRFIPKLLIRATSISESGFSMSWNIQGIKDYYSLMCKQYGLDNELSPNPKVIFL